MTFQPNDAAFSLSLLLLAGGIASCTGQSQYAGRQIVQDLESSRIPMPNDAGRETEAPRPAELPVTGPITLTDLLRVAEARSPDLAAARSDVGVAAGQRWQASLYPNPRADVYTEDFSLREGFTDAKTTVGVTQPIIIGNRRQAAIQAATAEQAARLANVEAKQRTLFGNIAAEHARLIAIHEQQKLYGELRQLADRTLSSAKSRFEAKAAPETDVIRPRVEVYRIEAALGRLNQEKAATSKRLSLLLGGAEVDPNRLDGTLSLMPGALDVEALQTTVRTSHPSLIVSDREIDAAAAKLDRVKAEVTPDLDVRVAAGYRGGSEDGIVEFGAGMAIPLWDAKQGHIMSARFELMRARQQRIVAENDLLSRLAEAVGEYEAARTQLDTFREKIVPDAQRAFEQTGEGYRGGRSSFLDLLDSQRTLTEARVTLTELASSVTAARARILQVVGPDGLGSPVGTPASTIPEPSNENRPKGEEVTP